MDTYHPRHSLPKPKVSYSTKERLQRSHWAGDNYAKKKVNIVQTR